MKDFFNLGDGRGSRLPDANQINEAVMSADPDTPTKLGEAHADDMVKGSIRRAEYELAEAQENAQRLKERRAELEKEQNDALTVQHLVSEAPLEGKRQPFWQRVYNGLKCLAAAGAPFMGGAYLVSAMQDQSYSLSQNPHLAVLAAGPLLLFSFAASSWALLPSDVRRAESRTGWLLGMSILAFVVWGALIAMRFGTTPSDDLGLAAGFDPTAGGNSGGSLVWLWLEHHGISVGALCAHLLAEGLLSAACISSALLAGRKVLVVDSVRTSHGKMLDEAIDGISRQLQLQSNITADAQFQLNECTSTRHAIVEEVTQAVNAKREDLEARKTAAIEEVRKSVLQR